MSLIYEVGDIVTAIKVDIFAGTKELPIGNCVVYERSVGEGGWENKYALYEIKRDNHSAWYDESSLELVKKRDDELEEEEA